MSVSSTYSVDTTYSIRVDDASSTVTYVGEAPIKSPDAAPVWRIKKLETLGTVLSITWADGNQSFDNVWSDRLTLSYS
jgi:hypothetical protein